MYTNVHFAHCPLLYTKDKSKVDVGVHWCISVEVGVHWCAKDHSPVLFSQSSSKKMNEIREWMF